MGSRTSPTQVFFLLGRLSGRRRGTWPTGACAVTDDAAGETTPCAAAARDISADISAAAYDRARIPPKRAVREGVFGRPARRRHCASNSLVGVTGGPALRAGNGRRYRRAGTSGRIVSRKWPRTSRRGPGTYGPGAPRADVLGDSTGAAGRRHAGLRARWDVWAGRWLTSSVTGMTVSA